MGREASDPIMVHSSIALLQERFRQLQRVKEMREEKELLRMLAEPPNKLFNAPTPPTCEPFKFLFQPDFVLPLATASPPQLSLSLWPCPQSNTGSCFQSMETPMFVSSQFSESRSMRANPSHKSEDLDDVDTSLHL